MNLEMLRGNIGWRMRLSPKAIHLDEFGRALPGKNEDGTARTVSDTAIEVEDPGFLTRIVRLADHIQSLVTDQQV